MFLKSLFAAAQFVALRIGEREFCFLLRDAVPQVFDKLKALRSAEFEEWRKFSVHARSG